MARAAKRELPPPTAVIFDMGPVLLYFKAGVKLGPSLSVRSGDL